MNKKMENQYQSEMEQIKLKEKKRQEIRELLARKEESSKKEINEQGQEIKIQMTLPKTKNMKKRLFYGISGAATVVAVCVAAFAGTSGNISGGNVSGGIAESTPTPVVTATPEVKPTSDVTSGSVPEESTDVSKEADSVIASVKIAEIGVANPELVAVRENYMYFAHYSGFVVYDMEKQEIVSALDTMKYDINHTQGSDYTQMAVTEDGKAVYFTNMEATDGKCYKWEIEPMQLYYVSQDEAIEKTVRSNPWHYMEDEEEKSEFSLWMKSQYEDISAYYMNEGENIIYFIAEDEIDWASGGNTTVKDLNYTVRKLSVTNDITNGIQLIEEEAYLIYGE